MTNIMNYKAVSLTTVALLASATTAFADERPPTDALQLSEVVKVIEVQGYSPITEISIDNGIWEIETFKDGIERDLMVNPRNGEIISDRLDN